MQAIKSKTGKENIPRNANKHIKSKTVGASEPEKKKPNPENNKGAEVSELIAQWRAEREQRQTSRMLRLRQMHSGVPAIPPPAANLQQSSRNNKVKMVKKQPAVPVKHNKASQIRLLKVNPLLADPSITSSQVWKNSIITSTPFPLAEKEDRNAAESTKDKRNNHPTHIGVPESDKNSLPSNQTAKPKDRPLAKRKQQVQGSNNEVIKHEGKFESKTNKKLLESKPGPSGIVSSNSRAKQRISRSFSSSAVHELDNSTSRTVVFKTPNERKSSYNVFSPAPDVLQKRLVAWLEKRGKTLGNFHHLHCFGVHHAKKQESNAKIPPIKQQKASNDQQENSNAELPIKQEEILKEALRDLHNLIEMGYPIDQCEQWLKLMRQTCSGCEVLPVYWECFASLEEMRGDFNSAIDCYGQAIVHGAETETVGESLEKLWEKFTALNLKSTKFEKTGKLDTLRNRKPCIDVKSVFRSSVIKFALQQRPQKTQENEGSSNVTLQYVVTPVRRSTRKSTSIYRSTPNISYVKTVSQLESGIQESMLFTPNKALDIH